MRRVPSIPARAATGEIGSGLGEAGCNTEEGRSTLKGEKRLKPTGELAATGDEDEEDGDFKLSGDPYDTKDE